ncbi:MULTISPECIES: DUF3500 domain-containing protein [unclassified Streptomyces]|uniref:DUF3500 domain-containing protein n=1 Tax=unclassified Streptomyces TaxID=2593676 RepID=UPI0003690D3B|nr:MULTISPECIES: DUF3500 domain-containing protein [unclassified Streptomyces]MYY01404.1 DUF3500 domain-containing protein [Streptomyces sp. SID4913]
MSALPDEDIDGFFTTSRTTGREEAVELTDDSYRTFLRDLDDPKLAEVRGMTYEEFAQNRYQAPFLRDLLTYWDGLYREPFVGITSDGAVREGLYALPAAAPSDIGAGPAEAAVRFLGMLTPGELDAARYDIDAPQWRAWSNPEFMVYRVGLRMEVLTDDKKSAIHGVLRASLSPEGYARVEGAMELNGRLGDLVGLPTVMNRHSYWFSVFGDPAAGAAGEPWGWQLFGHHVALNFVSVGGRHVIAPVFLGAEPALMDDTAGRHEPLFAERERLALELAGSLTAAQRDRAVVFESVLDPAMPEGRLHPADERHVAGAFRDNRVIPYEGIPADELDEAQRNLLRRVVADFLHLLAEGQRELALAEYDAHLDETWFSWYGATDGSQPFYFRVHSPVLIAEFDDHAGVWLSNELPARFHAHTTLRHPNGNDYAKALIARWRERGE